MCFKKLFNREKPHKPLRVISFAINDYLGTDADLRGCINDQIQVEDTVSVKLEDFDFKLLRDAQVTVANTKKILKEAVEALIPGDFLGIHYSGHGTYTRDHDGDEADGYDEALYLYDGLLIDDEINEILQGIPEGATVFLMLDCCYSGTATRDVNVRHRGINLYEGDVPPTKIRKRFAESQDINWVVMSGSGEKQTSADAYIAGDYHGAFTWFAMHLFNKYHTYRTWHEAIVWQFRNSPYSQIPTLEGRYDLLDKLIFT
jgi:hypothetical protein